MGKVEGNGGRRVLGIDEYWADIQLCPNMTFAATPPYTYGTLARYCKSSLSILSVFSQNPCVWRWTESDTKGMNQDVEGAIGRRDRRGRQRGRKKADRNE